MGCDRHPGVRPGHDAHCRSVRRSPEIPPVFLVCNLVSQLLMLVCCVAEEGRTCTTPLVYGPLDSASVLTVETFSRKQDPSTVAVVDDLVRVTLQVPNNATTPAGKHGQLVSFPISEKSYPFLDLHHRYFFWRTRRTTACTSRLAPSRGQILLRSDASRSMSFTKETLQMALFSIAGPAAVLLEVQGVCGCLDPVFYSWLGYTPTVHVSPSHPGTPDSSALPTPGKDRPRGSLLSPVPPESKGSNACLSLSVSSREHLMF